MRALRLTRPGRRDRHSLFATAGQRTPRRRQLSLALTAVVSITNAISLGLLSHLLFHKSIANGRELIVPGALIWLTNILIFAL